MLCKCHSHIVYEVDSTKEQMLRISDGERCMRLMEVLRRVTFVSLTSIGLMSSALRNGDPAGVENRAVHVGRPNMKVDHLQLCAGALLAVEPDLAVQLALVVFAVHLVNGLLQRLQPVQPLRVRVSPDLELLALSMRRMLPSRREWLRSSTTISRE